MLGYMKSITTLKRNDTVTLCRNCSTMNGDTFLAGQTFRFLALTGYGVRLSRDGDRAKLGVSAADIGMVN